MDPAVEVGVEQRIEIVVVDAPVVEALREDDDVPREAVAADVGRLPDPGGVDLALEGVVERTPVLRTAAVALPVRADDEERMLDRDAWRPTVEEAAKSRTRAGRQAFSNSRA